MTAKNTSRMSASIAQTNSQTKTIYCPLCDFFFEYDVQISALHIDGVTTLEILDGGEALSGSHDCDPR